MGEKPKPKGTILRGATRGEIINAIVFIIIGGLYLDVAASLTHLPWYWQSVIILVGAVLIGCAPLLIARRWWR